VTAIRVCFFGDSFVNGTGDDTCLGWVGRACAASRHQGCDLTCYNLGIRRDTSADIRGRWQREAQARLPPEHDGRLVFSFGANDCCLNDAGTAERVACDEAMANAREILSQAHAWRPTLMMGPLPVCDRAADARVAALSDAFASVCAAIGVPYLAVFDLAANSPVWRREVIVGDGAHPNAGGYSIISEAFQRWPPWCAWSSARRNNLTGQLY
jgi:acyl-CoA thioesterase I